LSLSPTPFARGGESVKDADAEDVKEEDHSQ